MVICYFCGILKILPEIWRDGIRRNAHQDGASRQFERIPGYVRTRMPVGSLHQTVPTVFNTTFDGFRSNLCRIALVAKYWQRKNRSKNIRIIKSLDRFDSCSNLNWGNDYEMP